MNEGGDGLRGLVIEAWENAGRPRWTVAETIEVTESIDEALATAGRGRAPKFRAARLAGDRTYIKSWVNSSRLKWLSMRFGIPSFGFTSPHSVRKCLPMLPMPPSRSCSANRDPTT